MKSLDLSSGIELLYPQCDEVRQAAAMLRTQHEQIKVLREALQTVCDAGFPCGPSYEPVEAQAEQALKDTEPT